ncbi:MAG: chromosome partition protein Smc [marine bacterium B5-7]|nr:MAG: chromosome partition protein Smc [marine bacterium B5-7]
MRLKKLKVSGFKSFVDPTPITVPANLVGIVGPNGCGKSNVIDAVRWVMGESSAKTLRGDQMADVIFNGSTSRKPVGKASVELLFHNDDGKVPESYANFSEIGIRRTLTRDGKSEYFINNTRARRRDIQDIFRGTGLGPRSYSIIEQGMVTRIIESKPEDLRGFVEEAAGISKYKDRRRETENRIRHTRENLERVVDIITELDKQLRRLQRQSQAARRYKSLKEKEHQATGELYLMRQRALEQRAESQQRTLAEMENRLQEAIAEQRSLEQNIEGLRVEANERREEFNRIQAGYYEVGSKISNLEQRIEHERQTRRQREEDLQRLNASLTEIETERDSDRGRLESIQQKITDLEADRGNHAKSLDAATIALRECETEFLRVQQEFEAFNTEALMPQRQLEVQQSVIDEQTRQQIQLNQRLDRLESECTELKDQIEAAEPSALREQVARHRDEVAATALGLEKIETAIAELREQLEGAVKIHSDLARERHSDAARLDSLKEIQAAALGEGDDEYRAWVDAHGLNNAMQLISTLQVNTGWEQAADAVLGSLVKAIVADRSIDTLDLSNATSSDFSLVEAAINVSVVDDSSLLAYHVRSTDADIQALIGDVRVAETLADALNARIALNPGQIMVTRNGLLVGRNWIRLPGSQSSKLGILAREEEIRSLERRIVDLDTKLAQHDLKIQAFRGQLANKEAERAEHSQALTRCNREHADLQNSLGQREARHNQLSQRLERFSADRDELTAQLKHCQSRIGDASEIRSKAEQDVARYETERHNWQLRRQQLSEAVDAARERHQECRDAKYEVDTRWQLESSSLKGLEEGLKRLETRRGEMRSQVTMLEDALSESASPKAPLDEELAAFVKQRATIENELNLSRQESERVDHAIGEKQQHLLRTERLVEQHRESVNQQKIENRETELKIQTLLEQVGVGKHDLLALAESLPEDASESAWRELIESIVDRIDRIGPVNLVAIEEYEEQSERKTYLDAQHADLTSALDTLEEVIRKIDRETRTRFKETFDQLNEGFKAFFPQLFGGGTASLELTENDYLTTGVTVMARPPGKRNSTIHLLSGGEKALTAVSLLFSLFKLNPAPFCLLDEVDAPLDDANVERYCQTLRTLSEHTQLLVITHNKITMEAADVLIGVTMSEPGVSRLVAVDIEEAVKMAAN